MERQVRKRRIISLLLAICIFAVFALSTFFVITHADHECSGAGCEICHEIKACLATVQHLSAGMGLGAAYAFSALPLLLCLILAGTVQDSRPDTLVALNIRLND